MCGRFRLTRASKLAERFGIEPEDDWVPRYNIAPTQNIEVIRQHAEEPKRFGSHMRWGLIPYWAKDASIGYKMINARADPEMRPEPISPEKREDVIVHMAAGLMGAYRYFREGRRRNVAATFNSEPRSTSKVGRNEPCPCGSGKKYKKCCGGATVN
jgi:hypothetical protein